MTDPKKRKTDFLFYLGAHLRFAQKHLLHKQNTEARLNHFLLYNSTIHRSRWKRESPCLHGQKQKAHMFQWLSPFHLSLTFSMHYKNTKLPIE